MDLADILDNLSEEDRLRVIATAAQKLTQHERNLAFDPNKIGSRPNPTQEAVIKDYFFNDEVKNLFILGGNQGGKTLTLLRILSWMFTESYPGWKRPETWGTEGATYLVLSRTGKQISESLLPRITAMLEPGTYKIITVGNIPQAIHSTVTKNRIVFQSYENESVARERVQSYPANGVFIDEMPRSYTLLEECQRRVQAKKAKLITAFTPKIVSTEIRKAIDAADGVLSKKYQLLMLDNPVYTEKDKQRIMAELATATEAYRNTVLTGAWLTSDLSAYNITDEMIRAPVNYHKGWRHCEASDPASGSTHGMVILAEDPANGNWYVVEEHEITGLNDPLAYVDKAEELTRYHNIVRRICDPANLWYKQLASKRGMTYMSPWNKNSTDRRLEMIKNLQVKLGKTLFIAPWCVKLVECMAGIEWSPTREGVFVNSDKHHLENALRYGVDCLPPYEGLPPSTLSWEAELRAANERVKQQERMQSVISSGGRVRKNIYGWGRRK